MEFDPTLKKMSIEELFKTLSDNIKQKFSISNYVILDKEEIEIQDEGELKNLLGDNNCKSVPVIELVVELDEEVRIYFCSLHIEHFLFLITHRKVKKMISQ